MNDVHEYVQNSPLAATIIQRFEKYKDYYVNEDPYPLISTIMVILVTYVVFRMGKSRGRGDVLISKELKHRVQSADTKKDHYTQLARYYDTRSKNLASIVYYFYILLALSIILSVVFYQIVLEYIDQFYMEVFGFSRIIRMYFNQRSKSIQKMLITYQREKNEIGDMITKQLGPELTKLLKEQVFAEERKAFEEQKQVEIARVNAELTKKFQEQALVLHNRIKDLESKVPHNLKYKEAHFIQQQRRATGPLPSPQQSPKIQSQRSQLDLNLIQVLKEERNIMKKFISSVCQFDWGDDCLALLEVGADVNQQPETAVQTQVRKYMKFSHELGTNFNKEISHWRVSREQYKKLKQDLKNRKG